MLGINSVTLDLNSVISGPEIERIILVVLDGLRPDAITRFNLKVIDELAKGGAYTYSGRTVQPSVTVSAMASLFSGAIPTRHGYLSDRIGIPSATDSVHPMPRLLQDHGIPTSVFMESVPLIMKPLAHRLAGIAGVQKASFAGRDAHSILGAAERTLKTQETGLIVLHWPDADKAGHANGWMSPQYAKAARNADDALGDLAARIDADDASSLLIVVADHGGGGARANEHDSTHPLDYTIPIVFAGGGVAQRHLGSNINLLDVPATILWSMGIAQPESYAGRPIRNAFRCTEISIATESAMRFERALNVEGGIAIAV